MEVIGVLSQLLVFAVFAFIIFGVARHQARKREEAWRGAADRLGLTYHHGDWFSAPSITGAVGDQAVHVGQVTRKHGKSSTTYTVFRAPMDGPIPAGLSITREGFGDALMKMLGGQDIQIGDPVWDPKLRIKGDDPAAIRALLRTPDVNLALAHLVSANSYSRIRNGEVVLEERGNAIATLDARIGQVVQLAQALSGGTTAPWAALAQRHGLHLTRVGNEFALHGTIDGFTVAVRAGWAFGWDRVAGIAPPADTPEHDGARISIKVGLAGSMPAGLRLRLAPRDAPDRGIDLPDPVLDGMIEAFGDNPEEVRALVSAPVSSNDLHGDLLAVLHAHPGSEVTDSAVLLHAVGVHPEDGDRLLDDALRLARSITEAGATVSRTRDDATEAARARSAHAAKVLGS
ncbi:MAG: hypothetical protein H6742_16980 [Alphaproteobacteria bacterium]|nr:hypothetical protein [Alphaproteobacteria bacterium]